MRNFAATVATLFASIASAQDYDITWESQGHFKIGNPAFPYLGSFEDSEPFLLMSYFSANWHGGVYVVPGVADAVQSGSASHLKEKDVGEKFEWPNAIEVVPWDVFGERAIHVPDGFLVPGKQNGGVYVLRMDADDVTKVTEKVQISPSKKGFFYHMGFWVDLNGDGRKDFITARADATAGDGELVWFEHPEGGLDVSPWVEHVVTNGPDVGIEIDYFDNYPGEVIVFASEFFNEKVSIHRVSLTDGSLVESRVVDDSTILAAYSISLVDLNQDGQLELLVNNHETDDSTNGIWAYTVPADNDLMNGEFTKMTIATNFQNVRSLFVPAMSPGFPYAIWPNGKHDGERAHIFVAGDGDYDAHILYPEGDNATDFGYTDVIMCEADGTVGALAFSDLDNDGWTEVWMPNYDKGYVELFKLSASTEKEHSNRTTIASGELELDLDLSDILDFANTVGELAEDFAEGFMDAVEEYREEAFL